MTTDDKPQVEEEVVSATEESRIADDILKTANEQPVEEVQPEAPKPPAFDPEEWARRIEQSVQGRTVNTVGELRRQVKAEIEAALAPVREFTTRIERARVEQMEPEEQLAYYKKKAEEVPESAPARTAEPAQEESRYTAAEQQDISSAVSGMLSAMDLDLEINDRRLWEGWQQGDSPARLKQIALQNARKIKSAQAPKTPTAPAPPASPPSTNGAPRRSATTVTERGDLYRRFSDPNDQTIRTSTELNKALADLKANGKVTL